jgi:hypothetical protein
MFCRRCQLGPQPILPVEVVRGDVEDFIHDDLDEDGGILVNVSLSV